MIYGNFDLRRGDHDGKPEQNKPPRWAGNDNPVLSVVTAETAAAFLGTSAALGVSEHVRKLQEDLITLGFSIVGTPDGGFGSHTEWAVREFQIYASMAQVAKVREEKKGQLLLDSAGSPVKVNNMDVYFDSSASIVAKAGKSATVTGETVGPVSYYVDSLQSVANSSIYAGPISGVVNELTRAAIEYWLSHDYRCPVVVEAWNNTAAGVRTDLASNGCNLWAHNSIASNAPRVFFRDFTSYYDYPDTHSRLEYQTLGYYEPGGFGGPNTAKKHSWSPEAEMSILNLYDSAYNAAEANSAKISTYRTMRVVAEAECYGRFDVLNAWDNALMSAGPCHWTMGVFSTTNSAYAPGELPGLIAYVKNLNPEVFNKAFGKFGLDTVLQWGEAGLYFPGVRTYNTWIKLSTETDFEALPTTKEGANYMKTWHWHYRFSMAGRTIGAYRKAMWKLTKLRLSKILDREVKFRVSGHEVVSTLGAVFTSEKSVAILLRWHVYRPAFVVTNASLVVPAIQFVIDSNSQVNWALPVASWGDTHETLLTNEIQRRLAALNDSITNAIQYGTNLPQGAVRPGRNSFIMDV
ncbi:peptidoglycan-binding protein [Pseudomonas sp. Irchel s3a12]|jgi:peptidoglycan hydrolase-like protein with peptidoglycan-binding domain|uniref:peptidoglycan-binding domain-containing protein n=1 Tax=Pseudomonas sp. Irchel s3a12 TaxID=2009047 RepID=UPI000BA40C79|nr:peptidoglycan-binding protein [Pseudomonas sp. Irchel s3a12]